MGNKKINMIFILIIGAFSGGLGGYLPILSGGLPGLLWRELNIQFGYYFYFGAILVLNTLLGTLLGIWGANIGTGQSYEKGSSVLIQLFIALIWGFSFGLIPNIFLAGTF